MKKEKLTFRIWHNTKFGIGIQIIKAKDKESLKIPKWIQKGLIEIENISENEA